MSICFCKKMNIIINTDLDEQLDKVKEILHCLREIENTTNLLKFITIKFKFEIKISLALFTIHCDDSRRFGDPYGNRTHHLALRGLRLNRLTNGP